MKEERRGRVSLVKRKEGRKQEKRKEEEENGSESSRGGWLLEIYIKRDDQTLRWRFNTTMEAGISFSGLLW